MTKQERKGFFGGSARRMLFLQCLVAAAGIGAAIGALGIYDPATAVTQESSAGGVVYGKSASANYLSGRFAANEGDFENAGLYLSRTMQQDPNNLEIAGYTYRMHLITGDMDAAARLARRLYDAEDQESNPEIMVLLSTLKTADYAEADKILAGFDKQGFNLIVVPLIQAWVNYAKGSLKAPLKSEDILQDAAEFAPFIYYQVALVNDMAGFEETAIEQYETALRLSGAMPYRVVEVLANLYARRNEWDKADALLQRYKEENPEAFLSGAEMIDLTNRKTAPLRKVATAREGIAEIFFSTASILHGENLHEEALIYIQQVLYLHPDFAAAQMVHGGVLEALGRLDEALEVYSGLPADSPYYNKATLRKAYTLNALAKTEDALKLLDKARKTQPGHYQLLLTRGDILMREKRFAEAEEAYTEALKHIPRIQNIHWPVFYARGISAERIGKWTEAEKDFLKALELEAGQPDVMNYLGYTWLTQNTRIEEAKTMIASAMAARPADAHIIDSMGWAYYISGDYAKAVDHLEKAIELMPTDPTVNDHLGDVYWSMGRRNEARFQWKRALLFDPEPELVETLTQKLESGLPAQEPHTAAADAIRKQQRAELN